MQLICSVKVIHDTIDSENMGYNLPERREENMCVPDLNRKRY